MGLCNWKWCFLGDCVVLEVPGFNWGYQRKFLRFGRFEVGFRNKFGRVKLNFVFIFVNESFEIGFWLWKFGKWSGNNQCFEGNNVWDSEKLSSWNWGLWILKIVMTDWTLHIYFEYEMFIIKVHWLKIHSINYNYLGNQFEIFNVVNITISI